MVLPNPWQRGTRAVRIVEGKQARLRFLIDEAAGFALEAFAENHLSRTARSLPAARHRCGSPESRRKFQDRFAAAFAIANLDRIRQARADVRRTTSRSTSTNTGWRNRRPASFSGEENSCTRPFWYRRLNPRFCKSTSAWRTIVAGGRTPALAALGFFHRLGKSQAKQHVKPPARFERQHARRDFINGVAPHFGAAFACKKCARHGHKAAAGNRKFPWPWRRSSADCEWNFSA